MTGLANYVAGLNRRLWEFHLGELPLQTRLAAASNALAKAKKARLAEVAEVEESIRTQQYEFF